VVGLDVLSIEKRRYGSGEEGEANDGVFHLGVSVSLPG
jgi:hypothetical protein